MIAVEPKATLLITVLSQAIILIDDVSKAMILVSEAMILVSEAMILIAVYL